MLNSEAQVAKLKVEEADLQVGQVRAILQSKGIKFDLGSDNFKASDNDNSSDLESDSDEEAGMIIGKPTGLTLI